MIILGISAWYHDSSAALIINDKIISAVQEERFTRIKNDNNFPLNSIKFCLNFSKIKLSDVDYICFYEKPFTKFERIIETQYAFAPFGIKNFILSMPIWLKEKLFQKRLLVNNLREFDQSADDINKKLLFSEHHLSHAASAFYPSSFNSSAIVTIDGVGEWTTTSICKGVNEKIEILKEIHFPNSLGLLYSTFTSYLGFKVNSGEYKMMGLAPFGEPIYIDLIKKHLIEINHDGSFKLNMKYFHYCVGDRMFNKKFCKLFNLTPRKPKDEILKIHMDLACSIQKVIEEVIIKICKYAKFITKEKNLCLSGGVALNCVANGKILEEKIFDKLWIQPASGDSGASLGAALAINFMHLKRKRLINSNLNTQNVFLGPSYETEYIRKYLIEKKFNFYEGSFDEIINKTAILISQGKAIGWFQGRMEFGPRALGARSILADPRLANMQKQLNLKIKYRESFRPFAPSVLREKAKEWFELNQDSEYMLLVSKVNKDKCYFDLENKDNYLDKINQIRSLVPAITHIDYSARVQTVDNIFNPVFYKLISKFYEITQVPLLINTSFNVRGEPIVCSPKDALKCFMGTNLDILVIENFILQKKDQKEQKINNYMDQFFLD